MGGLIEPVLLQADLGAIFGAVFLVWAVIVFVMIFVWWWIGSLSFRTKRIADYLEATQANLHYIAKWLEANHQVVEHMGTAAGSLATISRVFQEEQAYAHKDDSKPTTGSGASADWKPPG